MINGFTVQTEPKFKVGDLVIADACLGRVREVAQTTDKDKANLKQPCEWKYLLGTDFKGGNVWMPEYALRKADWRDVTRITKGGQK